MKKIPMLFLLITPYIFVGICASQGLVRIVPAVWLVFFLIVLLPNMIYAFILPRLQYEGRQLLFWNMLLKLFNVPIYIGVFLIALLLNIFIIPLIPLLFLFDYSLLLPSTMYGISGIWQCYRKKQFSAVETVINFVLQFLFCFDVCSSIYCYIRARRTKNNL